MREKELKEIRDAENRAALMMINLVKDGRAALHADEIEVIEDCMELAGCNDGPTVESVRDRRRIEASTILRDCITAVDRAELKRIDRLLMEVAGR